MAKIRNLEKLQTSGNRFRSEVDCTYQEVHTADGTKYIQLTTYGSDTRKSDPKSSQTIHLDKDMAQKLIAVLSETFDI